MTWEAPCNVLLQGATAIADIDPDGDTATVRPYACPYVMPLPSIPPFKEIKGTGGTLTLKEDSLEVDLTRTFSGCEVRYEGELVRFEE